MPRPSILSRWRLCLVAMLAAALGVPTAAAVGEEPRPRVAPAPIAALPAGASPGIPTPYLAAYRSAGASAGVDWRLLAAIGAVESDHGRSTLPGVRSAQTASGVAGPAQLCVAASCGAVWQTWQVDGDGDGHRSVHDPEDAFHTAARYVQWLAGRVGSDPARVLAAYNAGPGAVIEHGGAPPYPETRRYVDAGTRLMAAL